MTDLLKIVIRLDEQLKELKTDLEKINKRLIVQKKVIDLLYKQNNELIQKYELGKV